MVLEVGELNGDENSVLALGPLDLGEVTIIKSGKNRKNLIRCEKNSVLLTFEKQQLPF